MRKFLIFCVLGLCFSLASLLLSPLAKAASVTPTGVYWDLEVSYGSGTTTLDSDSDSFLTPSIPPITNGLPNANSVEVLDNNYYFDAYADYSADVTSLEAYVEGFADNPLTATDWYTALSKAAIASDPFSGASIFTLSFDWTVDMDFDSAYNTGLAKIAVGIIDWTQTTDPNNPVVVAKVIFDYTDSDSGTYTNSWNLDPTHAYIFGVGALASISGSEDIWGGSVDVYIDNLRASTVPEPASVFLVGAGLFALAVGYRRGRK